MKILLVEDNIAIMKGLTYALQTKGYQVVGKHTVRDTKAWLKEANADLVILDVTLPDGNGFSLFEETILPTGIPTIFLTAKDDEESIVKGLDIGAEDYLTKPFSTKELLARIHKILLRSTKKNIIEIDEIRFDVDKMICYRNQQEIPFTPLELKLLYLLIENQGKTVSRATILDKIWELTGNDVDDHTVTVYFRRIREKLGVNLIRTIKGVGYCIDEK